MKDVEWHWTEHQEHAFNNLKQLVTEAPVLKYSEPKEELTLQIDSSYTGLGAVLTQNGQPIAFASRALSNAETGYVQIKKELLAVVFGLVKFHQHTYGRPVTVQSDHKPLGVIVKKPVYKAPKCLQCLLLRLLVHDVYLLYQRGSQMKLADTLSLANLPDVNLTSVQKEVEAVNVAQDLPISAARVDDSRKHMEEDHEVQELIKVILTRWPEDKSQVPNSALPYNVRDELTAQNGVISRGERVVLLSLSTGICYSAFMPHTLLLTVVSGELECLYWPRMSIEVKDYVQQCDVCQSTDSMQQKEPPQPHDIPSRPADSPFICYLSCLRNNLGLTRLVKEVKKWFTEGRKNLLTPELQAKKQRKCATSTCSYLTVLVWKVTHQKPT